MGRTVCGQQEPLRWILLPSWYTREGEDTHLHGRDPQVVEHRTTPSILYLSRKGIPLYSIVSWLLSHRLSPYKSMNSTIYQQDLRRYHSRRIKSRTFQEGDLVLRLMQKKAGMHKLSSPWEGPFVVSNNIYNGSYYLVDIREKADTRTCMEETPRPWNIAQLRPYYTWVEQEHYCIFI